LVAAVSCVAATARGGVVPARSRVAAVDQAVEAGQLTNPITGEAFLAAGSAPGVVAASTVIAPGAASTGRQSTILVFEQGAGVWTSKLPAASLEDSQGSTLNAVAVSGDVIAAGTGAPNSAIDVFSTPATGWFGVGYEQARLRTTDGGALSSPAFLGSAIFAAGVSAEGRRTTYVFTRPTTGWHGDITEAARLSRSTHVRLPPKHLRGPWIIVGGLHGAAAFSEPRKGWHGDHSQVGFLRLPTNMPNYPAYTAGRVVVIGPEIFTEPRRGWTGVIRPSAQVRIRTAPGSQMAEAITGRRIVLTSSQLGVTHACPCTTSVWTVNRPRRGWSGRIIPRHVADITTQLGYAQPVLDRTFLSLTGSAALPIFRLTPVG
jgi:hypothetical protein